MSFSFSYSFGYVPSFSTVGLVTTTQSWYVNVSVYPLFYSKIIVEWSIPASLGACTFNVYKSDIDTDPNSWTKLNPVPITSNVNFLEDIVPNNFSIYRRPYYKVEVILPAPDGRSFTSYPSTWINQRTNLMEIRATEITRRENVLLDKFIGVDTYLYRRKYFGARCPQCYDENTEKVIQDHCTACFGTSFLGGYYNPILTKVAYDTSPNNTILAYIGKLETNETTAWTTAWPDINSLDIIYRVPDAKIFRVGVVNNTELQTVQVRQMMQIIELDKNSVEMAMVTQNTPSQFTTPGLTGVGAKTATGYTI